MIKKNKKIDNKKRAFYRHINLQYTTQLIVLTVR